MGIPKTIHYCWLGGAEKDPEIKRCMQSWEKYLPDYEVIEWNEKNVDIDSHPHLKHMCETRQYAFASDYIRLLVLYEHGGIYFDTDVLVQKSFDPLLEASFFCGFMFDCAIGTAVIGSEPGTAVVENMMKVYDERAGERFINNTSVTNFFLEDYPEFRLDGSRQSLAGGIDIFPRDCFEFASNNPSRGYSRHLALNLWNDKRTPRSLLKKTINAVLGDALYGKLTHFQKLRSNEFYPVYLRHRKKA
tara:strand:+ start:1195 stop:1932 length:738 start_codon:yes stop_codon:yes gene_type:complete